MRVYVREGLALKVAGQHKKPNLMMFNVEDDSYAICRAEVLKTLEDDNIPFTKPILAVIQGGV